MYFNDIRPFSATFYMSNGVYVVSCMHIVVNACNMCKHTVCLLVSCLMPSLVLPLCNFGLVFIMHVNIITPPLERYTHND